MQTSTSPAPTTTVFIAPSTSSKGLSGGAIAGIVIACIVGILLLAGAGLFLRNRRRSRAAASGPEMGSGAGAEMEGTPLDGKNARVLPYTLLPPTNSHTELQGDEAAHEVETPISRPVEMQG